MQYKRQLGPASQVLCRTCAHVGSSFPRKEPTVESFVRLGAGVIRIPAAAELLHLLPYLPHLWGRWRRRRRRGLSLKLLRPFSDKIPAASRRIHPPPFGLPPSLRGHLPDLYPQYYKIPASMQALGEGPRQSRRMDCRFAATPALPWRWRSGRLWHR